MKKLNSTLVALFIFALPFASKAQIFGDLEEVGEKWLVTGWHKSLNQSFSLSASDLKLTGTFPLNTRHPFVLKGFDKSNNLYSFEIKTAEQKENIFRVDYFLTRGTRKESGTLLIEMEKLGKIIVTPDDVLSDPIEFETRISE